MTINGVSTGVDNGEKVPSVSRDCCYSCSLCPTAHRRRWARNMPALRATSRLIASPTKHPSMRNLTSRPRDRTASSSTVLHTEGSSPPRSAEDSDCLLATDSATVTSIGSLSASGEPSRGSSAPASVTNNPIRR